MARQESRREIPPEVSAVRRQLLRQPRHELADIAAKLISDDPEIVAMWCALKRRSKHHSDDLWVWAFLKIAIAASRPPTALTKGQRHELAGRIAKLAKRLVGALRVCEQDTSIIFSDSRNFNGFFIYEDFGDSNRKRIDATGNPKLKASTLIEHVADRAKRKIINAPAPGKSGRNAKAVYFVRVLAMRNLSVFSQPLHGVVATAANALFNTSYSESDVRNHLARAPLQSRANYSQIANRNSAAIR